MVMVQFLGQSFQIVNGPGTEPNGTFALRRPPAWAGADSAEDLAAAMSDAQLNALVQMAEWAESNLAGETGTETFRGKRVPSAAAEMARQWAGTDFGGMSDQQLRERRKQERIDIGAVRSAAQERNVNISRQNGG